MKVTFIGLGVMGYPMAGHLIKSEYQVTAYNRSHEKAKKWLEENKHSDNASIEQNIIKACQDSDVVISCIGKDDDVWQVITGKELSSGQGEESLGILHAMKKGSVFIDHSTISAEVTEKLYQLCKIKQVSFIDAPVSGGQKGAETGQLTVMVGGDEDIFSKVEKLIGSYAKAVTYIGPSGHGQRAKMVNQICIAGLLQGLSEALAFSQKAGLDSEKVLQVISKGAAQSWQMENRGLTMINNEFDFGFAIEHMCKDLNICIGEGKKINADLTVTKAVESYYQELIEQGGNRWDTSCLIKRLL